MAQDIKLDLAVSDHAIRIFQQNPGLTFSAADLRAINAGTLLPLDVFVRPTFGGAVKDYGCITALRYESDTDLVQVSFDSGSYINNLTVANLNDFRQTFQTAANFGFGITACFNTATKKLSMVNLIPCRCKCDGKD